MRPSRPSRPPVQPGSTGSDAGPQARRRRSPTTRELPPPPHRPRRHPLGPVLILGGLVVAMTIASPVFLTTRNIGNVLSQTAVIAVLAVGQLLVILTRGIDLSVGSTLALASVVGAIAFEHGSSGAVVMLVMLATGAAVGFVNGTGYVWGRLPHPFIITLATLSIARGLALRLSGGQPMRGMPDVVGPSVVDQQAGSRTPRSSSVASPCSSPSSWRGWCGVAGSTPSAATRRRHVARASRSDPMLISVYVLCGLLAGVAAIITSGRLNAGSPTSGDLAELDSIAAVIIGGASFLGGRGTVVNALVGAVMIGVIRNGMNLLNVDAFLQPIVIGVVIVLAVESDVVRGRARGAVPRAPGVTVMTPALAVRGATKRFGAVLALDVGRPRGRPRRGASPCSATTAPASRR